MFPNIPDISIINNDPTLVRYVSAAQQLSEILNINKVQPPNFIYRQSPYFTVAPRTVIAVCSHMQDDRGWDLSGYYINNVENISPHFVIYQNGNVVKHIALEDTSKMIPHYTFSPMAMPQQNPDTFCVSIMHEGYIRQDMGEGYGCLTKIQFLASVQLQCWIASQLPTIKYLVGHSLFDSNSPSCPGLLFPWVMIKSMMPSYTIMY